jgi:hypothetical protein
MAERNAKLVLVRKVRLWWYLPALVPIVALFYFGFSGVIHPIFGLIGLFLLIFWLMSLIFALVSRFSRRPKEPRQ